MWGAPVPEPEARKVTLFRHMWGLLLGSAQKLAALTSMDATGGHGPDSDVWWEHLFLLRVERQPLLALLAADQAETRQAVVRMCLNKCLLGFDRAAKTGADCRELELVRAGHCGDTLSTLFFHVLHVRKMKYVQTMQLWDGVFFATLLGALLRALRSGQLALQGPAIELLLTIATAEPALSSNTTFGMVLDFTDDKDDTAAKPGDAAGKPGFGLAIVELLGQAESEKGAAGWSAVARDAVLLLAIAAHYQRGETPNSFVRTLQHLGPQDSAALRGTAAVLGDGLAGWLISVRGVATSAAGGGDDVGTWEYLSSAVVSMFWAAPTDAGGTGQAASGPRLLDLPAAGGCGPDDNVASSGGCALPGLLLLLYELLYRSSEPFCRVAYEVDKEELRRRRGQQQVAAAADDDAVAVGTLQVADGGLLGKLMPGLLGVCSALFVEASRRPAATAENEVGAQQGGVAQVAAAAAPEGAVELCLNACLCLLDDRFVQSKLLFDPATTAATLGPTTRFTRAVDGRLLFADDAFGPGWAMGDRLLAVGLLAVQHCRLPRHGAAGAGAELGRRLGPLGKALALLHRLLCLKKAAVAGRPAPAAVPSEGGDGGSDAATAAAAVAATGFEQWDGLWDALIGLLGRLTPDSEAGSPAGGPGAALVGVWAQLLNLLNLAVTYGHQLLPTVAHYDRLLYELLRAQPAFGRLQKAAAALGDGGGAAAVVLRPLANAVAIAAQIGLDATMEVDELLPLIAAGRSKLQLRLLPDLDRFDAYSEGATPPAAQRRLVNTLVASVAARFAEKNAQP